MTYGISGISPLGTAWLGSSAFGSYDAYMPSSYMGYGNMYGLGGYGMGYGMYSPMMDYPMYMAQMQNQIEASQLIHAGNMHGLMLNNEVQAYKDTDTALFRKILTNGDVQQGIYNLHQKVVEGDQKGVCEEYDKLRSYIFNTYRSDFEKEGTTKNAAATANDYIEKIYSQIISAQYGQTRSLKTDIKSYGDHAFENGFNQGYRAGHSDVDVDETLNHIYGTRINEKQEKDFLNTVGKGTGYVARGAKKGAVGAAVGAGATFAGLSLAKFGAWAVGNPDAVTVFSKKTGKAGVIIGAICAAAAIAGDIIWRHQDAA